MLNFTINSVDTYWSYWYSNKIDYSINWSAPSLVVGSDIQSDSSLIFSATGLMAGKYNSLIDTIGDYSNAAGIIFKQPSKIGALDVVQLNLPDGTKLGNSASYGAVLIGNPDLGWHPIFSTTYEEGLGTSSKDEVTGKADSLNSLFGQSLSYGTKLFVTYNDIDQSNPGEYVLTILESIANESPSQFSGNYYQFIDASNYSSRTSYVTNQFLLAQTAASSNSYRGLQGYLATITSKSENEFVANLVGNELGKR